jgi:hypothetical protein
MRCIVTGGEENSIGLKCGSIEGTGGGLERWFVVSDIDVRFLATVVGPMDTCCCLWWLFVRSWPVNWSLWLTFVVLEVLTVEELDWLSISSRRSRNFRWLYVHII